jgi:ATP-dependent DNA helicase RecG
MRCKYQLSPQFIMFGIQTIGRNQATRYFIEPKLLRNLDFTAPTTLKRIEPHRLAALILEDNGRYPNSSLGEIHSRIGLEIPKQTIKRMTKKLAMELRLGVVGIGKGSKYSLI